MSRDWTGNGNSIWKTLGASNHTNKEREVNDYYATSPAAIDKLGCVLPIHIKVWECACGEGHLSKRMKELGHDVLSTDLVDRGYGTGSVDFLNLTDADRRMITEWSEGRPFDIITNPPYKYATEFILKALELIPDDCRVIMFLKTTFLEGKERREKLYDVNPPRYVFQFSGRMVCAKNGDFESMKHVGSAVAYAWFVFCKHNYAHKTEIKWI